jgi:hypothetical protein
LKAGGLFVCDLCGAAHLQKSKKRSPSVSEETSVRKIIKMF